MRPCGGGVLVGVTVINTKIDMANKFRISADSISYVHLAQPLLGKGMNPLIPVLFPINRYPKKKK